MRVACHRSCDDGGRGCFARLILSYGSISLTHSLRIFSIVCGRGVTHREVMLIAILLILLAAVPLGDFHGSHSAAEECEIDFDEFATEYSVIVQDLNIKDPDTGHYCSVEDLHEHETSQQDFPDEVCDTLFNFTVQLLTGELGITSECCLSNNSHCHEHSDSETKAKVYGIGSAMVVGLCLLSLLGIIIIPLLKRGGQVYDYTLLLLVALGASALFSDAILHLLPEVFLASDSSGDEEGERIFLWRAAVVAGGMYIFYFLELALQKLLTEQKENTTRHPDSKTDTNSNNASDKQHLIETGDQKYSSFENIEFKIKKPWWKCSVKPLAVLIIVGDAFHNFADGLALGASISESLALGISTLIALVFHEVPHEIGDFAVLLSTGMSWPVALFFNFLSSLTSLAGFYIGASVGLESSEANVWMLALAAGTFFYISLVDLLPILINSKLKGPLAVLLINFGFVISFVILLLVGMYEHELEELWDD